MAVTEASRYAVHRHFEGTMGPELASTVMELLPPVGWGDVATKQHVSAENALLRQDLQHLRESMDERFGFVDQRFESVNQRFDFVDQSFTRQRELTTAQIEAAVATLRAEFNRGLRVQLGAIVLVMTALLSAFRFT